MNAENQTPSAAPETGNLRLKIIGIGTAGALMANQFRNEELAGTDFAFVNTDASVPLGPSKQVLLEAKTLRGLGTGGDPDCGAALAEEQVESLKALSVGTDVVLLVAGLGGGTGSGVTPVMARAAKESGALVLAFVTLPFQCEGHRRQQNASEAMERLKAVCDGVICLPNQKAFHLLPPNVGFVEAFRSTSRLLGEGLFGVWRLLSRRGIIQVHFEELRALLRERQGESAFATFEATGPERAQKVLADVATHPLLDGGNALEEATSVLISICAGTDLGMAETDQIVREVTARCPKARMIMGATVDEQFADGIAVTLIATQPKPSEPQGARDADEAETTAEFGAELIHPTPTRRPKARLVPPAPSLTVEQREQLITKQTGKSARARRNAGPRMRQTTLPLDIVNKGRFDKSEPTIHKGEDLDLPTYVRRGISLN